MSLRWRNRICDGGFSLDVRYAATRLRELCKMDGAVVLSTDGSRIVRANVQLVPDPSIPTDESGTRRLPAASPRAGWAGKSPTRARLVPS